MVVADEEVVVLRSTPAQPANARSRQRCVGGADLMIP